MRRTRPLLFVGLALLLASGGGWLAHRGDRAPVAGDGAPTLRSPAAASPAPAPGRAGRAGATATAAVDAGPTAPAHAWCVAAWQRIERERIAQLATEPDTDSQLAAALLDNAYSADAAAYEAARLRQHRRLQWALELAPGDPVVAAHAYRLCRADDGCNVARALDHLIRVDPDNAWTWVAVLERAQAAGDAAGIEEALERMAGSAAARSHFGRTALRLVDAFGEPQLPAGCGPRLAWTDLVIGARALVLAPVPLPLASACRDDVPDTRRRDLCVRALRPFAGGETLAEVMLATTLLVPMTAGTEGGAAWRERFRNLQWLVAQAQARDLFQQASPLAWWERGEVRYFEEQLRAMGAWPAPTGWLPDSEVARALVLTGRRPPPR